jgi:wyosine [tRNA(Phe)-imidazoG37] synthetase (radical SAM superfamily)
MAAYKYVFGPVASSRLGLSLGLDLIGPGKTCTLDCVYCEVGPTRRLTLKRGEYAPPAGILAELERWKSESGRTPDYITLGGRGEPCLNSGLAEIIRGSRGVLPGVPVAVLTNSTLLGDPDVRRDLALADAVLPSMDSLLQSEFQAVNRPHPGLKLDSIAESLNEFRREYDGKIFLEILLVSGLNDTAGNLEKLEQYVRELSPDRIDVATMTRPGTQREASPVDEPVLARWRKALRAEQTLRKSSPMRTKEIFQTDDPERIREMVLSSITRRPQTAEDLARALAVAEKDVEKVLADLAAEGEAVASRDKGKTFYGAF